MRGLTQVRERSLSHASATGRPSVTILSQTYNDLSLLLS